LLLFALKLPIPAFEKALQNLIYFNLGIWMSFNNSKVNAYLNNWYSFFGIVLLFIGSEFLFFNTSSVILELPMLFSAISGVAIIIFLANKIPDKSWASKFFSYLGSNSMPIYLASIIWGSGARIFLMKITKVYNLPIHLAVGTITGIACSLLMFEYCKKSRYLSWFFEYPLKRN
jgi:peptidoglycan/LPS O-acetylase OafA/YrhL